jgi:hypothetical protein
MKMMNIRKKIREVLEEKPDHKFSISEIADAIGSTSKATTAALGKLLKNSEITRPAKGLYAANKGPTPVRKQKAKPTEPSQGMSIITVDLLVEGEKPKIDTVLLLHKIMQVASIHDAKVKNVISADQTKLKIRVTLPD